MIVRPQNVEALRINPRTGLPEINPLRDVTRTWAQGTQRNARVSISANSIAEDIIDVQAERGLTGDFEIAHFTCDLLGPLRLEMYIGGGTDKRLSNAPVHVDLMCGTAQYPFYMPESLFLEARNQISVRFTNLAASTTNQVRLVAHGRRFLDYENAIERKELMRQFYGRNSHPFWLVLDDTSVALTADQTGSRNLMSVPGDADFEGEYLVAKSNGPFRLTLREGSGHSRPLVFGGGGSTTGVQSSHICGTALNPYRFTGDTAYFKRQTKVEAIFDDLSGAANTVEIAIVGRLLYYPESPDRARIVEAPVFAPPGHGGTPPGLVPPVVTSSRAPQGVGQGQFIRPGKPWWGGR